MSRRRLCGIGIPIIIIVALTNLGMTNGHPGIRFGPIHVVANRVSYTGKNCPVTIVFTATVNFRSPHDAVELSYHWKRSDGAMSQQQAVTVRKNERSIVIHDEWSIGSPGTRYNAWEALYVSSGNTHLSRRSPVVKIICK